MRFGGIALAAVLMLGACSGDPTPKEPTGTPSKPTPTSTATPPAMPDQAKEDSKEGAAAFVDHWVKVLNYAAATGDVRELSQLSRDDCTGCQEYISAIQSMYQAGGYRRGGDWEVDNIRVAEADRSRLVKVDISWEESVYRNTSDEQEKAGAADEEKLTFEVVDQSIRQLVIGEVN